MKSFLQEYGFAVLAAIVVIVLIMMTTPIGSSVKESLAGIINKYTETANTSLDSTSDELTNQLNVLASNEGGEEETLAPGLYDVDGKLLVSWANSNINVEKNYYLNTYNTDESSPYYVITNTYPTTAKVILPDNIVHIGDLTFYNCTNLESITIPNSVTSIGSAFQNCTGLTSVTIPDSVTSIGGIFANCTNLESITIPNSVTSIGTQAFYNCTGLTSITIPNSVTSIGNSAFGNCKNLASVNIPNNITTISSGLFGSCYALTSITIPNSVTKIEMNAFNGCTGLSLLIVPSTVTSIGNYAFQSVKNVSYSGKATGSPWKANNVFIAADDNYGYSDINKTCIKKYIGTNATEIEIPNGVVSIEKEAFKNIRMESIIIPSTVQSIGEEAFSYCSQLKTVTFAENSQLTSIGKKAFGYCSNLSTFSIPNGVTEVPESMFETCSNLASITIPNGVTSIGKKAFYNCGKGLASITIPSTVQSIGEEAFSYCSQLKTVTFAENSQLTSIGKKAFGNVQNLKNITIPNSTTSIDNEAFDNRLHVYYNGSAVDDGSHWGAKAIN